jgi:hypothetical protein
MARTDARGPFPLRPQWGMAFAAMAIRASISAGAKRAIRVSASDVQRKHDLKIPPQMLKLAGPFGPGCES